MNKRTLRLVSCVSVLAAGIVIAGAVWKPWNGKAETISRETVQETVLARYPGKIKDLVKAEDQYVMLLETDQGLYQVKADAGSGEIVYLERIGSSEGGNTPSPTPTPQPPASPSPSPSPSPSVSPSPSSSAGIDDDKSSSFIGAAKAKKIAAAHVRGKAEDVELKGKVAGSAYYLVEVEVEGGRDADVQVNAVSGAIMSVIWDDVDDKESNDDS